MHFEILFDNDHTIMVVPDLVEVFFSISCFGRSVHTFTQVSGESLRTVARSKKPVTGCSAVGAVVVIRTIDNLNLKKVNEQSYSLSNQIPSSHVG